MIYRLKFYYYKYQHIAISSEIKEARNREIYNNWKSLEEPGGWFHLTGLGHPVENDTIRERLEALFAEYPFEMVLTIPPSKPADIALDFVRPVISLSSELVSKAPTLLDRLKSEGVLIDYPYAFSLLEIRKWLESEKVLKKWPRLKSVSFGPVEIKFFGARYMVYDPSMLEGYRIKIFYCTNWLHDLVNTEKTKGTWHNWGLDQNVKYYLAEGGKTVVFDSEPPCGTFLFRVPEASDSVFCTQEFKDACETHGLEGLIFEPMALTESYKPCPPPTVQNVPGWTGLDYKGPNPSFGRKGRAAE